MERINGKDARFTLFADAILVPHRRRLLLRSTCGRAAGGLRVKPIYGSEYSNKYHTL